MRPSSRASTLNSAAAANKLREKKKEHDAVAALERLSQSLVERMECIGEDCDIMALAGEVHGNVLAQWPKMFQILNLFLANRVAEDDSNQDGQMLVRVPIEELQEQAATKR